MKKDFPFLTRNNSSTMRGDALYAIVLAVPTGETVIKSLGDSAGKSRLSNCSAAPPNWNGSSTTALTIQPVAKWPCQHAVVFKIQLKH